MTESSNVRKDDSAVPPRERHFLQAPPHTHMNGESDIQSHLRQRGWLMDAASCDLEDVLRQFDAAEVIRKEESENCDLCSAARDVLRSRHAASKKISKPKQRRPFLIMKQATEKRISECGWTPIWRSNVRPCRR